MAGQSKISFVGPPRAIRGFHLAADSLVQFRCVALHPSLHRDVVDRQIALGHQFFQIAITQRKPQVPAYAEHNDLVLKMPPLEQRWPSRFQGLLPYQTTRSKIATHPSQIRFWRALIGAEVPACHRFDTVDVYPTPFRCFKVITI